MCLRRPSAYGTIVFRPACVPKKGIEMIKTIVTMIVTAIAGLVGDLVSDRNAANLRVIGTPPVDIHGEVS